MFRATVETTKRDAGQTVVRDSYEVVATPEHLDIGGYEDVALYVNGTKFTLTASEAKSLSRALSAAAKER